jgi:hypothetical protein
MLKLWGGVRMVRVVSSSVGRSVPVVEALARSRMLINSGMVDESCGQVKKRSRHQMQHKYDPVVWHAEPAKNRGHHQKKKGTPEAYPLQPLSI